MRILLELRDSEIQLKKSDGSEKRLPIKKVGQYMQKKRRQAYKIEVVLSEDQQAIFEQFHNEVEGHFGRDSLVGPVDSMWQFQLKKFYGPVRPCKVEDFACYRAEMSTLGIGLYAAVYCLKKRAQCLMGIQLLCSATTATCCS